MTINYHKQDEDITTEESFRTAGLKAGLSEEALDNLIGQIKTEPVKEELKRSTQEALDLGVMSCDSPCSHMMIM